MARARNIKPGFFTNDLLAELPFETRLLFIGLWTVADREGRLEDRPKKIKMEVFPADDVNVEDALCQLERSGFIHRYTHGDLRIIQVVNFTRHQRPHSNEVASALPEYDESTSNDAVFRSTSYQGEQRGEPKAQALRPDTGYLNDDPGLRNPPPIRARPAHGRGANYPEDFERFWEQYPNKKAKDRALKAWQALRPSAELQASILAAIARQRQGRDWLKDGGQYIPHPATWLNSAGWMDEVTPYVNGNGRASPAESNLERNLRNLWGDRSEPEPEFEDVFETKGFVRQ